MKFDFFEHNEILHFFFNELYARARFFFEGSFFSFCKGILQKKAEKIMRHGKVKKLKNYVKASYVRSKESESVSDNFRSYLIVVLEKQQVTINDSEKTNFSVGCNSSQTLLLLCFHFFGWNDVKHTKMLLLIPSKLKKWIHFQLVKSTRNNFPKANTTWCYVFRKKCRNGEAVPKAPIQGPYYL